MTLEQDQHAVQATNNSSFMSKASMVMMGYAPQNLLNNYKLFLPDGKPIQRRAPLINRGYYIRYAAIQFFINEFLKLDCNRPLQILSLGCGYDATYLEEYLFSVNTSRKPVIVVECDFKPVIHYKMSRLLKSGRVPDHSLNRTDSLHSKHFHLISCDLTDMSTMEQQLDYICNIALDNKWISWNYTNPTLIVSECVLTYLPTRLADSCIKWIAKRFPTSMFVLYEQIQPDDSFSSTMINHFTSLNADIFAIHDYPTIQSQHERLLDLGFQKSHVVDMNWWWNNLNESERERINQLEPFDEYEEWSLKCSHYFVSCGVNGHIWNVNIPSHIFESKSSESKLESNVSLNVECYEDFCPTRWGHSATMIADDKILIFGGYGLSFEDSEKSNGKRPYKRLNDSILMTKTPSSSLKFDFTEIKSTCKPSPRLYHSCCSSGEDDGMFLFGGRSSPLTALNDLWYFDSSCEQWIELIDVSKAPPGRWGHSIIMVNGNLLGYSESKMLLLFGGRDHTQTYSDLWVFSIVKGKWISLSAPNGEPIVALHRFSMILTDDRRIVISGGLLTNGKFSDRIYVIRLPDWTCESFQGPKIFGAKIMAKYYGKMEFFVLIGGIKACQIGYKPNVVVIRSDNMNYNENFPLPLSVVKSRLWLGHEVVFLDNNIIIIGGGAVCFSMGTKMNKYLDCLSLDLNWRYQSSIEWIQKSKAVKRIDYNDFKSTWKELMYERKPFVIDGFDIGSCIDWENPEILRMKCSDKVSVHSAESKKMEFLPRNYSFDIMNWTDFVDSVFGNPDNQKGYYLRSIGENPRKNPSDIRKSFPELSKDIRFPKEFKSIISRNFEDYLKTEFVSMDELSDLDNYFSSILRISSPLLQLWTHYDIMDNFLIQAVGEKLITLIPPSEHKKLDIPAGINQSSTSLSDFDGINNIETEILKPGDILFIPTLWFHQVVTMNVSPAISINLFWKNLDNANYDRKDLYGNKDLLTAVKCFGLADEIISNLEQLKLLEHTEGYFQYYYERILGYLAKRLHPKQKY